LLFLLFIWKLKSWTLIEWNNNDTLGGFHNTHKTHKTDHFSIWRQEINRRPKNQFQVQELSSYRAAHAIVKTEHKRLRSNIYSIETKSLQPDWSYLSFSTFARLSLSLPLSFFLSRLGLRSCYGKGRERARENGFSFASMSTWKRWENVSPSVGLLEKGKISPTHTPTRIHPHSPTHTVALLWSSLSPPRPDIDGKSERKQKDKQTEKWYNEILFIRRPVKCYKLLLLFFFCASLFSSLSIITYACECVYVH
jgi:hypothetical protein